MASKPAPDSDARSMLAGLIERGEEVVGVFLEELGKSPRVREQVGKTVERAVHAKRRVDRTTQTVLSALNVPSRADYNRLLAKVEALQGSLVNLSMKLDRLLAHQSEPHRAPPSEPHRAAAPVAHPRRRARTTRKARGASA